MKLKELFTSIYSLIIILLIGLFVDSILMYVNNKKLIQSNITFTHSVQIANELRISSDDLTRYCRTYIETGDSTWANKYLDVLRVRNGKKPRPDNGRTIALQDTMRRLGFTDAEFAKLKESEKNSNNLVRTETIAFHAVNGLFADSAGKFTVHDTPDVSMARSIMFDEKYLNDKKNILKPIDDFILMVKQRTKNEVDKYSKLSTLFLVSVLSLIFIILIISIASFFLIKTRIIKQMEELALAKEKAEKSENFLVMQNETLDKKVEERTNDLKEKNKEYAIINAELVESELKFRNLIEHAGDAIFISDKEASTIVNVNEEACNLLGYTREELLSINLKDLFFKDDLDETPLRNVELLGSGKNHLVAERKLRKKDGLAIDTEINLGILEGSEFIAIVRDSTERKLLEIERENMVEDLLQRNRDLEQFSYIVSHNIRSPLSTLLGLSNTLKYDLSKKEQEKVIKGVAEWATKLDTMVKDLNEILKVKKQLMQTKTAINLEILATNVTGDISNVISNTYTQIDFNFSAIKIIHSIQPYLHSIFLNLITNSIKYTKADVPPEIKIWSEKKDGEIKIYFQDNGIGIDLKMYGDQVFGLYKKFNFSVEGRGMGLFMVKTQVQALKGSIVIESELDKGSTFTISFPNELEADAG